MYRVIESCTDPETLFAKIDSGHWDWLGVQQSGNRRTFILGRPRRGGMGLVASVQARHGNVETGRNRVVVRTPHAVKVSPEEAWWPTGEEARADFERRKTELMQGEGSGLFKMRLYVEDQLVDEHFVVRALPNRL
jgi:hypothetical protein